MFYYHINYISSYLLLLCSVFIIKSYAASKAPLFYDLPVDSQQSIAREQKCQPLNSPLCNIDSYLTLEPFNNTLGHANLPTAIAELHKFAFLFNKEPCKSKIQLFLCSLYAPVCVTSPGLERLLLPCRDDCEEARGACLSDLAVTKLNWPEEWDCRKFNYQKDDSLCVINNAKEKYSKSSSTGTQFPTIQQPPSLDSLINRNLDDQTSLDSKSTPPPFVSATDMPELSHVNDTMCSEDLFDCRLRDPTRNMNALCIDRSWVCDGKKDCVINGIDDGLDEVGCELKCSDGQLSCDGKCISKSDICNGKVDCSLGTDEQDCYDHVTGVIQSILCIFALFSAIYLLVKFFRVDDQKLDDTIDAENSLEKPNYNTADEIQHEQHLQVCPPQIENLNHRLSIEFEQQFNHNQPLRFPIYQEPAYSVATRSDYERLNTGGCSGASSVYMYCSAYHPPSILPDDSEDELSKLPVAPPPTPAPQQIYSTGSITKLSELYVNMNSPTKMDLLD